MRNLVVFLFLAMSGLAGAIIPAQAAERPVSGSVEKGLRVLTVNKGEKSPRFTVYRGDYIKFRFDESLGQLVFELPELKYKEKISPNPEASPLFKMTKEGRFPFTLGKIKGELTVQEYQQAHYKAVSPQEAKDLLASVGPFILDVRTPGEYAQGHLKGATLLPVQELQARAGELENYKNQDVFIYCASGNRSTVAAKILIDQGFKRIYNLRGGFGELSAQGLPIEK